MVIEYYEDQDRTETVSIKPGLKEACAATAKKLFPCVKVTADDAVEYLISTYLETTNYRPKVTASYESVPAPIMVKHEEPYEIGVPNYEEEEHSVISKIAPPVHQENASEINFATDQ